MPDLNYGSAYLYYAMQAPRERPAGYATGEPRAAYDLMRTLLSMNCGRVDRAQLAMLHRLGVGYVAVHRALFPYRRAEQAPCTPPPARLADSFPRLATDDAVTVYELPASVDACGESSQGVPRGEAHRAHPRYQRRPPRERRRALRANVQ